MLDPHAVERDVIDFFFAFSRFEFALKEAGYVSRDRNDNAAADWDAFVKKYKKLFTLKGHVQSAADYLISSPPQRQKVYEENPGSFRTTWEHFKVDSNAPVLKTLVDIVKVVRNNLFHGGKYGEKGWDDEKRVTQLLTNSTSIISEWLKLDSGLEVYFNDRA